MSSSSMYIPVESVYISVRSHFDSSSIAMTSFLFFLLWNITCVLLIDGFDVMSLSGLRNITMAVVVDKGFFSGKNEDYRKARTIILDSIHDVVQKEMHVGHIVVRAFPDTDVDLREDYTVLLSVATCERTWRLHESARQAGVLHLAITDRSCPRVASSEGISVPLINPGEELPQIFLDLRTTNALTWKNILIVHDDSFDREKIGDVVRAMTNELPNTLSNIASKSIFAFKSVSSEWVRRQHIRDILSGFRVERLGSCFLVIVTLDTIADVMEVAKSLKMVHPSNQWLYVLTDVGSRNSSNITHLADLLSEGGNVALVYNVTDSRDTCHVDLLCHVNDFVRYLAKSLQHFYKEEEEIYENITNREYEVFRQTKLQISRQILKGINTKFSEHSHSLEGECGKCMLWQISSAITWGNNFFFDNKTAYLIKSGSWTSRGGVNLSDAIFPHVAYGFRGLSVPIVTFHNPPWQTVTTLRNGEMVYGGLVFDVLKYLSKKLNFTYDVITPVNTSNSKLRGSSRSLAVGEVSCSLSKALRQNNGASVGVDAVFGSNGHQELELVRWVK